MTLGERKASPHTLHSPVMTFILQHPVLLFGFINAVAPSPVIVYSLMYNTEEVRKPFLSVHVCY